MKIFGRAAQTLRASIGRSRLPLAVGASVSVLAAGGAGFAGFGAEARAHGSTSTFPFQASAARAGDAAKPTLPKPQVLFVLGGPGAGKGTQCARLVSTYGYVHLSAGDLLREERDSGSPDGEMIEAFIREGKIVPVEVTVNLLRKAMERAAPGGGGRFLVDGFPRNFDNLDGWHRVMGDKAEVNGVLFYDCPEATMEKRLLRRGETSGRSDDTADVIRKRFHTYVNATMPVVNHYAAQGKVFKVNSDQPVDAVFAQTQRLLEPLIAAEVARYQQLLLDAVHAGDWALYCKLSDEGLTALEAESNGELVKGLPFHKFYFDAAAAARAAAAQAAAAAGKPAPTPSKSSMTPGTEVRLLGGTAAIVAGNRLVQREGRTDTHAETRAWQYHPESGLWRQVHFHRSLAGASAGLISASSGSRSS